MKSFLNGKDIKEIFESIKNEMVENKMLLIELDGAMGDGDLGLYMELGFIKITETVGNMDEGKPGEIIVKTGFILAQEAPSTLGTLLATAFMKAGKEIREKSEIYAEDIIKMGSAAYKGIMQRGGAKPGEKTILDSVVPAVNAIENAVNNGKTMEEIFKSAYEAAEKGVEDSKMLKSVHGRAGYFSEASIGKQDAGATAGMLVFKGIYNWVLNKTKQ